MMKLKGKGFPLTLMWPRPGPTATATRRAIAEERQGQTQGQWEPVFLTGRRVNAWRTMIDPIPARVGAEGFSLAHSWEPTPFHQHCAFHSCNCQPGSALSLGPRRTNQSPVCSGDRCNKWIMVFFYAGRIRRGRAMLESLNDHVRECLLHAEDCVQQAASQTDPKLRQDYLIIGACWLKLCYELSDQLASRPPVDAASNQPLHLDKPSPIHAAAH